MVIVRPLEGGLALHQLHFQTEVRSIKDLGIEPATLSEGELKLASQLIEHLAVKRFEPGEFTDEFRARAEAAIQRKIEGHEVSIPEPAAVSGGKVIDLMQALKASLNAKEATLATQGRRGPKRATPTSPRKASRR
jgi:DNA end-binding protein Ku